MSEVERVKMGDSLPTHVIALLEASPWSARLQVLTLLGVQAPSGVPIGQPARLWLILDIEGGFCPLLSLWRSKHLFFRCLNLLE